MSRHFRTHSRLCLCMKWWKIWVNQQFPAEVKQSGTLPSCFISRRINSVLSEVYLNGAIVLHFCVVLLVISLLTMDPKCRRLSNVSEHKKAIMRLKKKMHVLDELCSGISYSAAGHEFDVNEPTHMSDWASLDRYIYKKDKRLWPGACRNLPPYLGFSIC